VNTPGKWTRQDFLHQGATQPIVYIYGGESGNRTVVAKTDAQNAPLLLAAPELLAACKAALDNLMGIDDYAYWTDLETPLSRLLGEAIEKAEANS
jgi:hypothetical protein